MATQADVKTESGQFTPGPWIADPMVPNARQAFYIVATPDGNNSACDIATVGPTLSLRAEANARLITAAPELYEALQNLLPCAFDGPAYDAAVAILAKARGL